MNALPVEVLQKKQVEGRAVQGWHTRYLGLQANPWSRYVRRAADAANAITYLQDLTEEYGPLRVIPGLSSAGLPVSGPIENEESRQTAYVAGDEMASFAVTSDRQ